MPPKAAFTKTAFRPPRPVGSTSAAKTPGSSKSASHRGGQLAKHKSTESTVLSSDDSSDAEDISRNRADLQDSSEDSGGSSNTHSPDRDREHHKSDQQRVPPIPHKLLVRILHSYFQHPDTKITKEAVAVLSKYVELFVVEAIGRANEEREAVATRDGDKVGIGDFLEVEDLEKLAPQLMMDF